MRQQETVSLPKKGNGVPADEIGSEERMVYMTQTSNFVHPTHRVAKYADPPRLLCSDCIDDDDEICYPEPDSNCEACGFHPLARLDGDDQ